MTEHLTIEPDTALAEAMWQLLDDMGKDGLCISLLAKAKARVAYEPFREGEEFDDWMSCAEAQAVIENAERGRRR